MFAGMSDVYTATVTATGSYVSGALRLPVSATLPPAVLPTLPTLPTLPALPSLASLASLWGLSTQAPPPLPPKRAPTPTWAPTGHRISAATAGLLARASMTLTAAGKAVAAVPTAVARAVRARAAAAGAAARRALASLAHACSTIPTTLRRLLRAPSEALSAAVLSLHRGVAGVRGHLAAHGYLPVMLALLAAAVPGLLVAVALRREAAGALWASIVHEVGAPCFVIPCSFPLLIFVFHPCSDYTWCRCGRWWRPVGTTGGPGPFHGHKAAPRRRPRRPAGLVAVARVRALPLPA